MAEAPDSSKLDLSFNFKLGAFFEVPDRFQIYGFLSCSSSSRLCEFLKLRAPALAAVQYSFVWQQFPFRKGILGLQRRAIIFFLSRNLVFVVSSGFSFIAFRTRIEIKQLFLVCLGFAWRDFQGVDADKAGDVFSWKGQSVEVETFDFREV